MARENLEHFESSAISLIFSALYVSLKKHVGL